MLTLQPANPKLVSWWRNFNLGMAGASGLLALVDKVKHIFPQELLVRFPYYESFLYASVAISFITGLFLILIPKVLTLSFAQVGAVTSLVFIGYSLMGIFFSASLLPVFITIMTLAILVMVLVFGESLLYFLRRKAYVDFAIGSLMVIAASFVCLYPLYLLLTKTYQ